MALTRFLLSSPKILAAKTAISMIWRSPIMTVGVACEIIALSAAAWNWVDSYQWLPNAALTLATVGAVIVASRVAWDYHGRGLNAKQTQEVNDILTSVGLNKTQSEAMAETIKSSGLTQQQKSDLITELQGINLVSTVVAQGAVATAIDQFTRNGMQPPVLQFDGLCLMGSDLRGAATDRSRCRSSTVPFRHEACRRLHRAGHTAATQRF